MKAPELKRHERMFLERRVEGMESALQRLEIKSRKAKLNRSDMEQVKSLAKMIIRGRQALGKTNIVDRNRQKEIEKVSE